MDLTHLDEIFRFLVTTIAAEYFPINLHCLKSTKEVDLSGIR